MTYDSHVNNKTNSKWHISLCWLQRQFSPIHWTDKSIRKAGKNGWSDRATHKWHGGQAEEGQIECVRIKHDPSKQLKKARTVGQESIEFGTIWRKLNRLSQSTLYSSTKKLLSGRINRARGHSTLLTYIVQAKQDYNQEKGSEKLCQKKKNRSSVTLL